MKKIYLETVEEFVKALKNGEEIYKESDNKSCECKYYLIDGIIISEYKNGDKFINSGSTYFKEKKYYYYKKEPIKIEVGKCYKTRNGEKAYCFYKYTTNYEFNLAFIKTNEKPVSAIFKTRANGKIWEADDVYNGDDIVDYWEE